jgi:hypothetical protein
MRAGWRVFWLSVVVIAVAMGVERLLVPDVVPVGASEEAQASWMVLTAFALRSIELTAEWVAAITFVLMLVLWSRARLRRQTPQSTPRSIRPAD